MSDYDIRKNILREFAIDPFIDYQCSSIYNNKVISYGLSSYGYDARLFYKFKTVSKQVDVLDPKNINSCYFYEKKQDYYIIPPKTFILGRTVEYFRIPKNILVICFGKSTYSRLGLTVNVTPLEPEWEGYVTLSISNALSIPIKVYANEGICQFIFLRSNLLCDISYKDRIGKYMFQREIVTSKVI
jgi:dCTP deaminase